MFKEKCLRLESDMKWHQEMIDDLKIDMYEYKRFITKYIIPKVIADKIEDVEEEILEGIKYHEECYELESKILEVLKLGEGIMVHVETDREVIKGVTISCNEDWLSVVDESGTRDIYLNAVRYIKLAQD